MSIVVLQLGQGGNQYGFSFFDSISSSLPSEFFEEREAHRPVARAVLIDMEPKVVRAVTKKASASGIWKYSQHSFTQSSGSGNNWAAGYCISGPAFHAQLLNLIRRKVEACDNFGGFLAIQSLAGGTGAGLGAYLVEAVKDEYPSSYIMSHCIWPYDNGEVVVQNYNVLLTLSKLQEAADGIIAVHNEELAAICKRSLNILRPSFNDMNKVGASSLASVLMPSYWRPVKLCHTSSSRSALKVKVLSDVVYALCLNPSYRMLSLHSTSQVSAEHLDFTTFAWGSQLKQLRRSLRWLDSINNSSNNSIVNHKCVANMLVLRGSGSSEADVSLFADSSLYSEKFLDPLNVSSHPTTYSNCEKVAGLISNSSSAIIAPASRVLTRAHSMFDSRAYVHQYSNHGLDATILQSSFTSVEDILSNYSSL